MFEKSGFRNFDFGLEICDIWIRMLKRNLVKWTQETPQQRLDTVYLLKSHHIQASLYSKRVGGACLNFEYSS